MELTINKNKLTNTAAFLLQRAGYKYIVDRNTGKDSFVKVLGNSGYPRWHLYLEENGDNIVLHLHLDQKKPLYKGQPAHSGEYDSEVVKEEMERLRELFQ